MSFFEDSYVDGTALWETGKPQPEVVALSNGDEIEGSVLDVGCGTGENAIFLADRGHEVMGIDLAPQAIELARIKAANRSVEVEFTVWDATKVPFAVRSFDTVLDSGLFHVFDAELKKRYVRFLGSVVRAGGRAHVIVWSEHEESKEGPSRVTQAELRQFFAPGWNDIKIQSGVYETSMHEHGARAWVASMRKRPDPASGE